MKDEKTPPPTEDEPEAERGQTAETDAQGKVAPKADERSPAEQQAEADLLKTSGGNPLTQEG